VVFLTYPLGLGIYLSFTDTQIGPARRVGGIGELPISDDRPVFITAVWNRSLTVAATVGKFALGLWLALLLNQNVPFKSCSAPSYYAVITPTVLSAIAFWWIYDPQFSIFHMFQRRLHDGS